LTEIEKKSMKVKIKLMKRYKNKRLLYKERRKKEGGYY